MKISFETNFQYQQDEIKSNKDGIREIISLIKYPLLNGQEFKINYSTFSRIRSCLS